MQNFFVGGKMKLQEAFGNFVASSKRIFIVSKKPDNEEFWQTAKVTGLGIIIIAIIGFIVYFLFAVLGLGR